MKKIKCKVLATLIIPNLITNISFSQQYVTPNSQYVVNGEHSKNHLSQEDQYIVRSYYGLDNPKERIAYERNKRITQLVSENEFRNESIKRETMDYIYNLFNSSKEDANTLAKAANSGKLLMAFISPPASTALSIAEKGFGKLSNYLPYEFSDTKHDTFEEYQKNVKKQFDLSKHDPMLAEFIQRSNSEGGITYTINDNHSADSVEVQLVNAKIENEILKKKSINSSAAHIPNSERPAIDGQLADISTFNLGLAEEYSEKLNEYNKKIDDLDINFAQAPDILQDKYQQRKELLEERGRVMGSLKALAIGFTIFNKPEEAIIFNGLVDIYSEMNFLTDSLKTGTIVEDGITRDLTGPEMVASGMNIMLIAYNIGNKIHRAKQERKIQEQEAAYKKALIELLVNIQKEMRERLDILDKKIDFLGVRLEDHMSSIGTLQSYTIDVLKNFNDKFDDSKFQETLDKAKIKILDLEKYYEWCDKAHRKNDYPTIKKCLYGSYESKSLFDIILKDSKSPELAYNPYGSEFGYKPLTEEELTTQLLYQNNFGNLNNLFFYGENILNIKYDARIDLQSEPLPNTYIFFKFFALYEKLFMKYADISSDEKVNESLSYYNQLLNEKTRVESVLDWTSKKVVPGLVARLLLKINHEKNTLISNAKKKIYEEYGINLGAGSIDDILNMPNDISYPNGDLNTDKKSFEVFEEEYGNFKQVDNYPFKRYLLKLDAKASRQKIKEVDWSKWTDPDYRTSANMGTLISEFQEKEYEFTKSEYTTKWNFGFKLYHGKLQYYRKNVKLFNDSFVAYKNILEEWIDNQIPNFKKFVSLNYKKVGLNTFGEARKKHDECKRNMACINNSTTNSLSLFYEIHLRNHSKVGIGKLVLAPSYSLNYSNKEYITDNKKTQYNDKLIRDHISQSAIGIIYNISLYFWKYYKNAAAEFFNFLDKNTRGNVEENNKVLDMFKTRNEYLFLIDKVMAYNSFGLYARCSELGDALKLERESNSLSSKNLLVAIESLQKCSSK